MTLLVASDLHLGAGASLGNRLEDQRSSWERVCAKAVELGADVLFGGDAFHARRPGPTEIDVFQEGLEILRDGGRTLVAIPGNHDILSREAPSALEVACAGFDAHVLRGYDIEHLLVETTDGLVGFLPWEPPAMDARRTADALMVIAGELAHRGARILIAHHALSGASLPTGLPVLELAEPILDSHALAQMGFDVVLSGHIHKRQVIVEEPLVAHIGPLSRGNFGERDVETGLWKIHVGGPQRYGAEWVAVPDRAFVAIEADVRDVAAAELRIGDAIAERAIEGAIVRVAWQQTADQVVDQSAILSLLHELGAHHVDRLQPIVERVVSTRHEGVTDTSDPRESFDRWLDGQPDLASDETLADVREQAHERIGRVA